MQNRYRRVLLAMIVLLCAVGGRADPVRGAELVGAGADSERAIRWLIALMVLCCDPLAIALTAAASARPC